MATRVSVACEWKCSLMSTENTQKWHSGTVSVHHSEHSCWNLNLFQGVKHLDQPVRGAKLAGEISKLIIQKKRILICLKSGTFSCTFGDDVQRDKIANVLTFIKSGPCADHSGFRCLTVRPPNGLKAIESETVARKVTGYVEVTPVKEIFQLPASWGSNDTHIKTPTNNFTSPDNCDGVKERIVSPSDRQLDDTSSSEKSLVSGKDSRTKNLFLDSSTTKADKLLSSSEFYGSRSGSSSLINSTGSFGSGVKRKPGLLSLNENENRKPRAISGVLLSTKKQATLDDMCARKPVQLQGFSNLGNTCYMNAILQSLFCLVPFSMDLQAIVGTELTSSDGIDGLCMMMARLSRTPLRGDTSANRERLLSRIKEIISKHEKRFDGHEQNDAHEFLSVVLDCLKDEVQLILDGIQDAPSPAGKRNICNPTVENFEIKFRQTVTCTSCKLEHHTQYILNDMSLDIPQGNSISIQDCLRGYFLPRVVACKCSSCNNGDCVVSLHFLHLPRIFILLLKRYRFNSSMTGHRKIVKDIRIPRYVTLGDHCIQETKPPERLRVSPYEGKSVPWPLHQSKRQREKFEFNDMNGHCKDSQRNDSPVKPRFVSADIADSATKYYDEEELKRMSDEERLAVALTLSCNDNGSLKTNHYDNGSPSASHHDNGSLNASCYDNSSRLRNRSSTGGADVDSLELTCEDVKSENPTGDGDGASPGFLPTPLGPRDSSSWVKSRTPDRSSSESAKNLKRRISKELFPKVTGLKSGEHQVHVDNEVSGLQEESEEDFESAIHVGTPASATNSTSKKRPRFSDSFDKSEDKENVLPPLLDAGTKAEDTPASEETLELDQHQTQEQFEAQLQLAIALSLQNQEMDAEADNTKFHNADASDDSRLLAAEDDDVCDDRLLLEKVEKAETEELEKLAESGDIPRSYRLMSVVSHLGDCSSIGHYVTDVFDISNEEWYSCDDKNILSTSEDNVRKIRQSTGYIFFYLSKELEDEIKEYRRIAVHRSATTDPLHLT